MSPKSNTTSSKGGWVCPRNGRSLSKEENYVRKQGFPWVSTSTIVKENPLGRHTYQSENTHLVIIGQIEFHLDDRTARQKGHFKTSSPADGLVTIQLGDIYRASLVNRETCRFVEGYRKLSVTTRDRFLERGTIEWRDRKTHAGPVQDDVEAEAEKSRLLRKANAGAWVVDELTRILDKGLDALGE
ncbi:hypothetical protein G7Y89_g1221 [Cudoniella acicularis]|uniref:Uncharacterized protein n=1 Tax=Cudoniella acicularis TaxID=354080 RepID=A0A8H4RVQ0_9HELO|nr:hypothetical protein G7Y89_g1221 [Cudoniella acicularis]